MGVSPVSIRGLLEGAELSLQRRDGRHRVALAGANFAQGQHKLAELQVDLTLKVRTDGHRAGQRWCRGVAHRRGLVRCCVNTFVIQRSLGLGAGVGSGVDGRNLFGRYFFDGIGVRFGHHPGCRLGCRLGLGLGGGRGGWGGWGGGGSAFYVVAQACGPRFGCDFGQRGAGRSGDQVAGRGQEFFAVPEAVGRLDLHRLDEQSQ